MSKNRWTAIALIIASVGVISAAVFYTNSAPIAANNEAVANTKQLNIAQSPSVLRPQFHSDEFARDVSATPVTPKTEPAAIIMDAKLGSGDNPAKTTINTDNKGNGMPAIAANKHLVVEKRQDAPLAQVVQNSAENAAKPSLQTQTTPKVSVVQAAPAEPTAQVVVVSAQKIRRATYNIDSMGRGNSLTISLPKRRLVHN